MPYCANQEAAQARVRELEAALVEQTNALGLRADMGALAVAVQADRILKLAEALVEERTAAAACSAGVLQRDADLASLAEGLQAVGLTGVPDCDSAGSVVRVVNAIRERRRDWLAAVTAEQAARIELTKASEVGFGNASP